MATCSQDTQPILAPDSADSSTERARPPRGVSRWRVAAVAAALAALVLTWARSGRSERSARGFLDEVIVKDEEEADSCATYMKDSGCAWTLKHNCPDQPAGSEGPATDDGTIGYKCCCKRSLWKRNFGDEGDSEPEPKDDIWTRREHPYFAALKESCTEDLKKYCSSKSFKDRSFLRAVNCLAEHRSDLDSECADAAFSGTLMKPHPKLFKIVIEGKESEIPTEVTHDDGTTSTVQLKTRVMYGYVQAPLMYTTPSSTPMFRTWFSVMPATTQPAPKGILFIHNGGPLPSLRSAVMNAVFGGTFGKHTVYFRNNFDIVSVDQRGMGMSALELLYGISPDTFSAFTLEEMGPVIDATADPSSDVANGALFSTVNISTQGKPNIVGETPCKKEDAEQNGGFSDFLIPADYSNEEQVSDWLTKKASAVKYCSDKFDKDDGKGKKYSPLQYVGTGALTYDMEYMRLAFGGPKISVLGFSYGTRVAAAYASAFPYNLERMGVTGVMAPIPDLVEYAQKAAANTAEILGWIVSQCALAEDSCSKNPWPACAANESCPDYFEGGIDDAVNELFSRSMNGGQWYMEHCGKDATPLDMRGLTQQLQAYLTTLPFKEGKLATFQNSTWPYGFAALPATVYLLLSSPCDHAKAFSTADLKAPGWSEVRVDALIPALDMTGRFDKIQATKFIADFAANPVFAPGLNMFSLYAGATYGWPQLPMPIGFSNQNVPAVIANGLYDERTGMAYAQDFKLHFPNSSLLTSLSGGHCLSYSQGAQAWDMLVKFLANGSKPLDGTVTGEYVPIDFEAGVGILTR